MQSHGGFWGVLNAKLLKSFPKLFYFAQDLQTCLIICSQYKIML